MRPRIISLFIGMAAFLSGLVNAQTIKEIEESRHKVDSIQNKLAKAKTDRERIKLYNLLAGEYLDNQSVNDSTLKYVGLAIALSEKNKDDAGLANAKRYLGLNYFYHNNISKATIAFIDALKIFETIKDKEGERKLTFDLARAYKDNREYAKARAYFERSLKGALEVNDKKNVVRINLEIAGCYSSEKNKEMALQLVRQNLSYSQSQRDTDLIASAFMELGNFIKRKGDLKESIKYYDTVLSILAIKENLGIRSSLYNNYARTYLDMNDNQKALYYFKKSLETSRQNQDPGREAIILRNLGLLSAESKQYKEAEKYFLSSLELCKKIDFLDMEMFNYADLTELYNITKDFQKAFRYYKIYTGKKDSLTDIESNRKSVESEMNYDFEKKQLAMKAEQAIAERIKEEEAEKQKMIRNVFVAGFCLMLILAVFIFRSYKQKQRANNIISKQKEEVEKQKDVIEEQKLLVEEKNKEVMDSIRYAKRIQAALMPSEKYIDGVVKRLKNKS